MDPAAHPPILARPRLPADPARLLALRGARAGPPVEIAPSRCNRCGACLRLGCEAISDVGGEALVVDAASCTGCGVCEPVCRGRAIAPAATS